MIKTKLEYEKRYDDIYQYCLNSKKTITELALELSIDRHALSRALRKRGYITSPHGKFKINKNSFSVINTEKKAYWLGFIYADGCVYKDLKNNLRFELSLKESDVKHLEKLKNFLKSDHRIRYKKEVKAFQFGFIDRKICNDLINLGVFERKSLILKFPTKEQVPENLIKHFIRGYIDGDGSISITKKQNDVCLSILGTKEFLEELITCLKIDRKLYKGKKHLNNTYFITYSGVNARKILTFLYKGSKIYLNRKYKKYIEIMNLKTKNGKERTGPEGNNFCYSKK